MEIGVLAYQGGIDEHRHALFRACEELRYECNVVNLVEAGQLRDLDAIVIPGGESTTITKLLQRFGMLEPLRNKIAEGTPTFGTCAGAVLLARHVRDYKTGKPSKSTLGVLDAVVLRNYYGRQRESFEVDITIPVLGPRPFRAIFIRAPAIVEIGYGVTSLARLEENHVLVQQGSILASTFHPELSGDTRLHKYFITMAKK